MAFILPGKAPVWAQKGENEEKPANIGLYKPHLVGLLGPEISNTEFQMDLDAFKYRIYYNI
jgi:hypothetical protein